VKLVLDLIGERESRLCPCEGREPEIYETGFLFSQETLDSCLRRNDDKRRRIGQGEESLVSSTHYHPLPLSPHFMI